MKSVMDAIAIKRHTMIDHPLSKRFAGDGDLEAVVALAPELTFWVLSFQDLLRRAAHVVHEPLARKVALHCRAEDRGHDDWFMQDLRMFGSSPNLERVFGPDHAPTRDTAYALMAELYRTESDFVRIGLLMVLEAVGQVFFEGVSRFVERTGFRGRLRYFARTHLEAEQSHLLWESKVQEELAQVELAPHIRREALAMIDRSIDAFRRLFDHLEECAHEGGSRRRITPARRSVGG